MNITTRTRVAVIGAAAAALIGATAGIASASTGQPKPGPTFTIAPPHGNPQHSRCDSLYSAYDGVQTNQNGWSLVTQAGFPGAQVTATRHPGGCGQFWFSPLGDGNKAAVLTSTDGVPGTQAIGEARHQLVVVNGDSGTADQWTFDGTGWVNVKYGDKITISSHGRVSLEPGTTTPNADDTFTFGPVS